MRFRDSDGKLLVLDGAKLAYDVPGAVPMNVASVRAQLVEPSSGVGGGRDGAIILDGEKYVWTVPFRADRTEEARRFVVAVQEAGAIARSLGPENLPRDEASSVKSPFDRPRRRS